MRIFLQYTVDDFSQSKRAVQRAGTAGMTAVGTYYEEEIKLTKFEPTAASTYGYAARSPKYLKRKQGGWARDPITGGRYRIPEGGTRDLVHSGRTRAAARMRNLVRAYPTRVTVRLAGLPKYISMRPYKSNHPAMGEEMTSATPSQVYRMELLYQGAAEEELLRSRKLKITRM
jgi:hypothetical protein